MNHLPIEGVLRKRHRETAFRGVFFGILLVSLAACAGKGGQEPIVLKLTPLATGASNQAGSATPTISPVAATPVPLTPLSTAGWMTYVNEVYRYQFQYPPGARVREARPDEFGIINGEQPAEDWQATLYTSYTGQICLTINYNHSFISIGAPPNEGQHVGQTALCGAVVTLPSGVAGREETLTIGGKTYKAEGFEFQGSGETLAQHHEYYRLKLANGTRITYGSDRDRKGTYADYLGEKETVRQIVQSIRPLEINAVPTPDFAQAPPLIEPLLTGHAIALDSWSYDGSILTFWEYTREDYLANPQYPRGTYHFYDVLTDEHCAYSPESHLVLDLASKLRWLPGNRLLLLSAEGKLAVLTSPCDPQITPLGGLFPEPLFGLMALDMDHAALLLRGQRSYWLVDTDSKAIREAAGLAGLPLGGATFSPEAGFVGITGQEGNTYIANVSTGSLVGVVSWTYHWEGGVGGKGDLPGPEWVSDDKLIVNDPDEGPQLVTVSPSGIIQVQAIAETFFRRPSQPGYRAYGAVASGRGSFPDSFHLFLDGARTPHDGLPRLLLYHSSSARLEELPALFVLGGYGFGPDGRYFSLTQERIVKGYGRTEIWLRHFDPPGSEARMFVSVSDETHPAFSADGELMAVASHLDHSPIGIITAYSVRDGAVRDQWNLGDYRFFSMRWSPDRAALAAVGSAPDGSKAALFILR